jgi:hypothetical protein
MCGGVIDKNTLRCECGVAYKYEFDKLENEEVLVCDIKNSNFGDSDDEEEE